MFSLESTRTLFFSFFERPLERIHAALSLLSGAAPLIGITVYERYRSSARYIVSIACCPVRVDAHATVLLVRRTRPAVGSGDGVMVRQSWKLRDAGAIALAAAEISIPSSLDS